MKSEFLLCLSARCFFLNTIALQTIAHRGGLLQKIYHLLCVQYTRYSVMVAPLKAKGRTEHQVHREVYRPWGKCDSVDAGARYQVKRITVMPGAKLSVQMHHHCAEL